MRAELRAVFKAVRRTRSGIDICWSVRVVAVRPAKLDPRRDARCRPCWLGNPLPGVYLGGSAQSSRDLGEATVVRTSSQHVVRCLQGLAALPLTLAACQRSRPAVGGAPSVRDASVASVDRSNRCSTAVGSAERDRVTRSERALLGTTGWMGGLTTSHLVV